PGACGDRPLRWLGRRPAAHPGGKLGRGGDRGGQTAAVGGFPAPRAGRLPPRAAGVGRRRLRAVRLHSAGGPGRGAAPARPAADRDRPHPARARPALARRPRRAARRGPARLQPFRRGESGAMNEAPIGVFDSGLGGMSVLRELVRKLPQENFIYVADSGHCPYGGKSQQEIIARAVAITDFLLGRGCKQVVVACNTATIAAVEYLRANYSATFVGMEPAVKPAVAQTRSGVVGVLA